MPSSLELAQIANVLAQASQGFTGHVPNPLAQSLLRTTSGQVASEFEKELEKQKKKAKGDPLKKIGFQALKVGLGFTPLGPIAGPIAGQAIEGAVTGASAEDIGRTALSQAVTAGATQGLGSVGADVAGNVADVVPETQPPVSTGDPTIDSVIAKTLNRPQRVSTAIRDAVAAPTAAPAAPERPFGEAVGGELGAIGARRIANTLSPLAGGTATSPRPLAEALGQVVGGGLGELAVNRVFGEGEPKDLRPPIGLSPEQVGDIRGRVDARGRAERGEAREEKRLGLEERRVGVAEAGQAGTAAFQEAQVRLSEAGLEQGQDKMILDTVRDRADRLSREGIAGGRLELDVAQHTERMLRMTQQYNLTKQQMTQQGLLGAARTKVLDKQYELLVKQQAQFGKVDEEDAAKLLGSFVAAGFDPGESAQALVKIFGPDVLPNLAKPSAAEQLGGLSFDSSGGLVGGPQVPTSPTRAEFEASQGEDVPVMVEGEVQFVSPADAANLVRTGVGQELSSTEERKLLRRQLSLEKQRRADIQRAGVSFGGGVF